MSWSDTIQELYLRDTWLPTAKRLDLYLEWIYVLYLLASTDKKNTRKDKKWDNKGPRNQRSPRRQHCDARFYWVEGSSSSSRSTYVLLHTFPTISCQRPICCRADTSSSYLWHLYNVHLETQKYIQYMQRRWTIIQDHSVVRSKPI